MNIWELAAEAMIFALLPCAWMACTGNARSRLVALEMTGVVITLLLMLLTMAFNRMPLIDLALALALMSFGAGIVYARFFARHL